jgi:cytochrome c oxidase subunit II
VGRTAWTTAWTRGRPGVFVCASTLAFLSGCGDNRQSTLDPHSSRSHDITTLWWGMLAAAGVVFAGVLFLIGLSILRRRREGFPVLGTDERKISALVVAFGILIPVLSLSVLFFIADIGVVKATDAPTRGQTKMTIDVVARQWFWEARYPGSGAVTANEIHIPARTPVKVVLTSPDVIHSFWVPELNKKVDAIPGHPNNLLLYADEPGVYRGQCAEFCGLQHAKMAMAIYADPPQRFRAWLRDEAKPLPASAQQDPGFQAFAQNDCGSCHTLRGTTARGNIGPDLTHLMSRKTIGALTIPNTPDHLRTWVLDPQKFKPGNRMPELNIPAGQFTQLMAFLRSLR